MKQEIMKLWVAALRSDDYVQRRRYLRSDTGDQVCHCALGVLCDIAPESCGSWGSADPDNFSVALLSEDEVGRVSCLPDTIMQWAGVQHCVGMPTDSKLPDITHLNDGKRMSFVEIADFIETNWEVL